MIGLLLALTGAFGVYLLHTALAFRWTGIGLGPHGDGHRRPPRAQLVDRLGRAGLGTVRPAELGGVMALLFAVGAVLAFALFGGLAPALVCGVFAAWWPVASHRARLQSARRESREAWPRMIEEIRMLTGNAGRSIPQALLEVGRRAPDELRPAFAAAEREWLISTDFAKTTGVLRALLGDPTADTTCETLLVAHEVGGADVDRRLAALAEDRVADLQGRKDALAKQAGVRFARRFVLVVPVGMALAGLSIGTGRSAYQTGLGQLLVTLGVTVVACCWMWAGRLMRLPEEDRVF